MEKSRFLLPPHVSSALSLLNEKGHEAFVVGGAVRDLFRGVPAHDYDITTSATPDEMKDTFQGHRLIETGLAHGTLTVLIDGIPLEITTYRVDGTYSDARHPDGVRFTRSLKEDAARRDFTVNAMAYHPTEGVLDFFGGKEDLSSRIIRCVGDPRRRFTEDALRILRALRFASVLDFSIEASCAEAIHELKGQLAFVASERIREELLKLICGQRAAAVLSEFHDVIAVFLPELSPLVGFDQKNPHHDFDLLTHTLRALGAAPPDPVLRLTLLLHDMGKPACYTVDENGIGHFYGHAQKSEEIADTALRRLRFDTQTRERVLRLVRMHDLVPDPTSRQFARLRSRYGDEFLTDYLTVLRADRTGQKAELSASVEAALREAESAAAQLLTTESRIDLSSLQLNGDDLLALGVSRGPRIGTLLKAALGGLLDGKVKNEKTALIAFLRSEGLLSLPIECERKFLIRMPRKEFLSHTQKSEIIQTYLLSTRGVTARVRSRAYESKTVYTHTEKRRLSSLSAVENEREISKEEYNALLRELTDKTRMPIQKTRYTLPFGTHLLEIDVYPFWQRQAVLEVELASEEEKVSFPKEIEILREVTSDAAYKNVSLSKSIPEEEASC